MSRTNRSSGSSNPVKRYLSFSGGIGEVAYYDKSAAEDDRKKSLESLDFVVLDIKSSISGYNEATNKQISSNLLNPFSVGKEEFQVKLGGADFKKGIWREIKPELDAKLKGCKFTTNIFAIADTGNGRELVRLELNGSALSPWIEFQSSLGDDLYDKKITITKGALCTRKDGETVPITDAEYKKILAAITKNPMAPRPVMFYLSSFSAVDIDDADADFLDEADSNLQKYFDGLGLNSDDDETAKGKVEPETVREPEPIVPAADTEEEDDADIPF